MPRYNQMRCNTARYNSDDSRAEFVAAIVLDAVAQLVASSSASFSAEVRAIINAAAEINASSDLSASVAGQFSAMVEANAGAALTASASLAADAVKLVLAGASLTATAKLIIFFRSQVTINVNDPLDHALGGYARITPVLASTSDVLFLPESKLAQTDDMFQISLSVASEDAMVYEFEPTVDDLFYKLATAAMPSSGDLGQFIRTEAGAGINTVRLTSVRGNFYNLLAEPFVRLMITLNHTAIDRAGRFVVPMPVPIPINEATGEAVMLLYPTDDLYSPLGPVQYEIIRDQPGKTRIGALGFTVPYSATELQFKVSGDSIIVE